MAVHFDRLPHHCTAPVTNAVEAYSPADGTAHGSLDATAYVCLAHVRTARDIWTEQGLIPYTMPSVRTTNPCGFVSDFRDSSSAGTPG